MERIKQALERARKQRAGDSAVAPVVTEAARDSIVAPLGEQSITYSQSHNIELSPVVLEANRIIGEHTDPVVVQAFKMLRTQLLHAMSEREWSALAITSPGAGEGKTLTAINLALSLAQEVNNTVLLVDLDLRNPGLIGYLGYQPEYGISDFLLNDVPLEKILVHPGRDRLVILPGRQALANSSEMLSSPKMVKLAEELKNRYPSRLVLFDMPPLLSADDALAFSPYVDAALLVIAEGKTQGADLIRAKEMLSGMEIIGTVLNQSEDKLPQAY